MNRRGLVSLNDALVSEIIDSVGLPITTNVADLCKNLDSAQTWFAVHREFARSSGLPKKIGMVKRAIQKLSSALDDDEVKFALRFSVIAEVQENLDRLTLHLAAIASTPGTESEMKIDEDHANDRMSEAEYVARISGSRPTEREMEINDRLAKELRLGEVSPFEWFVGKHLANIFKRHFGREAGLSRDSVTGQVTGPYVRFVEAVLDKLGIEKNGKPYTAESIVKARTSERSGRDRRKVSGVKILGK